MNDSAPRIYLYSQCSTCRDAVRFLESRGIACTSIPIREQPPVLPELQQMLAVTGSLRRLFNTSGKDYQALNLKEKLPLRSEAEALVLLASNGNLVKRPFLILADGRGTTGFKKEEWEAIFPS